MDLFHARNHFRRELNLILKTSTAQEWPLCWNGLGADTVWDPNAPPGTVMLKIMGRWWHLGGVPFGIRGCRDAVVFNARDGRMPNFLVRNFQNPRFNTPHNFWSVFNHVIPGPFFFVEEKILQAGAANRRFFQEFTRYMAYLNQKNIVYSKPLT